MDIRVISTVPELNQYEDWIAHHPDGSLWQSPAWSTFQQAMKRETRLYAAMEGDAIRASALVVIDRTTGGFSTWDIPRGPLGPLGATSYELRATRTNAKELLLTRIIADAKKDRCLALYLSPLEPLEAGSWKLAASPRHEQPEATRILDLTAGPDAILAQMHPKGRYNIKVAQKHGVTVRESADIAAFTTLARATAARDGFRCPSEAQYRAFLQYVPGSFLLLAYEGKNQVTQKIQKNQKREEVAKESFESSASFASSESFPIAGLIGCRWKEAGIYYYGASSHDHRALMTPYLLQWEAILHCKKVGCLRYDLLGVAPPGAGPNHAWQGISAFKEKFGGSVVTYPPERRMVLRPLTQTALTLKRRLLG